jgi:hypothetical protein
LRQQPIVQKTPNNQLTVYTIPVVIKQLGEKEVTEQIQQALNEMSSVEAYGRPLSPTFIKVISNIFVTIILKYLSF